MLPDDVVPSLKGPTSQMLRQTVEGLRRPRAAKVSRVIVERQGSKVVMPERHARHEQGPFGWGFNVDPTTRATDPNALLNQREWLPEVLDHVGSHNEIEGVIREWDRLHVEIRLAIFESDRQVGRRGETVHAGMAYRPEPEALGVGHLKEPQATNVQN